MTHKLEYVTREVRNIVTINSGDNRMEHVFPSEKLFDIDFNTTSGRHEIECFFGIDFEQEQVDAWTTVQNIIDDVMNLWTAPIADAAYKSAGLFLDVPEIATPYVIVDGSLLLDPAFMTRPGRLDPPTEADRAAHMLAADINPINRIERADVDGFANQINYMDANTLDNYQRIATKSAIYPGKGTPFGLMYAALGLAEAGEVQNKVKKAFRDDNIIGIKTHTRNSTSGIRRSTEVTHVGELTDERRKQIIKELGGVMWYIAAVCDEINATMSEVALANLDELCGRGERNTLRGDGDNR